MRDFISETQQVTRKVLATVACDRCGRETLMPGNNLGHMVEGGHIESSFGYGSRHDLADYGWDFCDDCVDALLKWIEDGASNTDRGQNA